MEWQNLFDVDFPSTLPICTSCGCTQVHSIEMEKSLPSLLRIALQPLDKLSFGLRPAIVQSNRSHFLFILFLQTKLRRKSFACPTSLTPNYTPIWKKVQLFPRWDCIPAVSTGKVEGKLSLSSLFVFLLFLTSVSSRGSIYWCHNACSSNERCNVSKWVFSLYRQNHRLFGKSYSAFRKRPFFFLSSLNDLYRLSLK